MSFKKFLFLFFLIAAIIGSAAYVLEEYNPADTILVPKFWVLFGFLFVLTIIAYTVSMVGIKSKGENSVYILMGAIIVKLLLCMSLVLLYLLKFRVNHVFFAAEFFSLYFVFTSFEVYALLCNLRHQNKT